MYIFICKGKLSLSICQSLYLCLIFAGIWDQAKIILFLIQQR